MERAGWARVSFMGGNILFGRFSPLDGGAKNTPQFRPFFFFLQKTSIFWSQNILAPFSACFGPLLDLFGPISTLYGAKTSFLALVTPDDKRPTTNLGSRGNMFLAKSSTVKEGARGKRSKSSAFVEIMEVKTSCFLLLDREHKTSSL